MCHACQDRPLFGRQCRYDFITNLVLHYAFEETVLEAADLGNRLPIEGLHIYLQAYRQRPMFNDHEHASTYT